MYLVTGTSSGIGLAIAEYLLDQGVEVVGVSRRSTPIGHPKFHLVQGDVADPKVHEQILALVNGKLDGVVFNAGILDGVTKLDSSDVDAWRRVFEVNLFSIVGILPVLTPSLRKSEGNVVFVSSDAATIPFQAWGTYGASKAAVNHLSMTLAKEEPTITSVAVAPGIVATSMQENIRENHTSSGHMDDKEASFFHDLYEEGKLVTAEQTGKMYGNLVLNAGKELNGKYYCHDDVALKSYN